MSIEDIRAKLLHAQTRRVECMRDEQRERAAGRSTSHAEQWIAIYEREACTLARMLRDALKAELAKSVETAAQ